MRMYWLVASLLISHITLANPSNVDIGDFILSDLNTYEEPSIYYREIRGGISVKEAISYGKNWTLLDDHLKQKVLNLSVKLDKSQIKHKFTSGWRPEFYNSSLRSGKSGVVYQSSPTSHHMSGKAVDIQVTLESMETAETYVRHLEEVGLTIKMPFKDPVHITEKRNQNDRVASSDIYFGYFRYELKRALKSLNRATDRLLKTHIKIAGVEPDEIASSVLIESSNDKVEFWYLDHDLNTSLSDYDKLDSDIHKETTEDMDEWDDWYLDDEEDWYYDDEEDW